MSLGIWKKMVALLSVICISVAVNGCGPAAETPTSGEAVTAGDDHSDHSDGEHADDDHEHDEDSSDAVAEDGLEIEGESSTE